MFTYCRSLTSLDVSNWDVSKVTGNYSLNTGFDAGSALVDFYPPKNISANMSMSKSKSLSHDSLIRIINNLITTTSTKTLTLGATNLAKLTADEVAIATNKGWTVK
jgi:surface protein